MPPTSKRSQTRPKAKSHSAGTPAQKKAGPGESLPYAEVFESSPQALALWRIVHDKRGRPRDLELQAVNKAFRELYRRTDPIPPGITLKDINPEHREWNLEILSLCSRVARTGAVETGEVYHPRLKTWFAFTVSKGPADLLLTYTENISDRREAESSLRRLSYSLDHIDDYPAWTDSEGRIVEVSESTCRYLEYTREELLGMTMFDICPDVDMAGWKATWQKGLDQKPFRVEVHHRTKSGRVYPVEIVVNPMVFDGVFLHCALCRDITERKKAQERLERLQYSLDTMEDYCIWVDKTGHVIEASESTYRHLGYSRDELAELHIAEIDQNLDLDSWSETWQEANALTTLRRETGHLSKDGTVNPVEIAVSHMIFGKEEYDCVFCRDIKDRKQAEQTLRDSEELHRQLFELESDAIILADDATGNILEVNEAACRLYDYTRDEFASLKNSDLFEVSLESVIAEPPDGKELVHRWHRRRDGTTFPIRRRIAFFEWRGRPVHVVAVRDVTDQKRAADELEESRKMLQLVLDTVPSRISWQDLDLRYLGCNAAAAADAGLRDPSVIAGLTHQDLPIHNVDQQCDTDDEKVMETGIPMLGYEERVVKSSGEMRTLRSSKVPLRDRDNNIIGVLGIHDDVTEQAETLKALRERDEQLLQAQKMEAVGRLAGGIAHDFNNVLTTIVGYSDLILSSPDCPPGSMAEDVAEIKEAAVRAGALTQRILAFSRRQHMQPTIVSLNDIVVDTEKLLARTIGADIELATSLDEDLGKVEVDEHQFVQVLLNLAVNARDAMPKGGKLTIATADVVLDEQFCETHPEASPGPHVMLTVADTGSGMDEEVLRHVFEPFYTTKPPGLGTGLGLATVYGVVTQSGGCIYVFSRPEKGTTVTIYLPRATEITEQLETATSAQEKGASLGTILVVDSDAPYRALTVKVLERRGFAVMPADDGEQAAKILADHSVKMHGLVTDLTLSGALQGEQIAELAVRKRPDLMLLFVSDDGSEAQTTAENSSLEAGYLEKPFTAEELHREVRTWVTNPSSAGKGLV